MLVHAVVSPFSGAFDGGPRLAKNSHDHALALAPVCVWMYVSMCPAAVARVLVSKWHDLMHQPSHAASICAHSPNLGPGTTETKQRVNHIGLCWAMLGSQEPHRLCPRKTMNEQTTCASSQPASIACDITSATIGACLEVLFWPQRLD